MTDLVVSILRCAAAERTSLNRAATIIEARDKVNIPARLVILAIEAWHAVPSDRPAGAYWDICLEAADHIDKTASRPTLC